MDTATAKRAGVVLVGTFTTPCSTRGKMITTQLGTKVRIESIRTEDRIRQEYGDVDALAASIKEHGLIQKIVLAYTPPPAEEIRLLVGGRRLKALTKIGVQTLVHGDHFLWVEDKNPLQQKGIELEENIRRQALSWQEEVLAKQQLLEIYQRLYGEARAGQPTALQRLGGSPTGFGVNKLAAMLGESNAATSKDLELARLITAVPTLAKAETKEAARRQASLATAVAVSLAQQAKSPAKPAQLWSLYEGDFIVNAVNISDASVDVVIVDPPYGEDVQGMAANSRTLLAQSFGDGYKETVSLIEHLSRESYRVLRPDTFAIVFFGFAVYNDLVSTLINTGFEVDTTPLIWVKTNVINTSPYTRYGRSYEPILVARKGNPKLMRPSQKDVIQVETVLSSSTKPEEQKFYHTQKPVALIEKFILDMTAPGATVVDFCAGSGTTGVAATRLGRRSILFEKNPVACQIIKTRLGAL
jgi:DNA modification methylase